MTADFACLLASIRAKKADEGDDDDEDEDEVEYDEDSEDVRFPALSSGSIPADCKLALLVIGGGS